MTFKLLEKSNTVSTSVFLNNIDLIKIKLRCFIYYVQQQSIIKQYYWYELINVLKEYVKLLFKVLLLIILIFSIMILKYIFYFPPLTFPCGY